MTSYNFDISVTLTKFKKVCVPLLALSLSPASAEGRPALKAPAGDCGPPFHTTTMPTILTTIPLHAHYPTTIPHHRTILVTNPHHHHAHYPLSTVDHHQFHHSTLWPNIPNQQAHYIGHHFTRCPLSDHHSTTPCLLSNHLAYCICHITSIPTITKLTIRPPCNPSFSQ